MTDDIIRILICAQCKTFEELPVYDGPPDYDDTLNYLLLKHRNNDGTAHAPGALGRISESEWNNLTYQEETKRRLIAQVDPNSTTGFGIQTYDTMNTFREDAMTCWTREHNRDPGCSDYMSDKKRIAPGTAKERKELGLNPKYDAGGPGLTRHLCDWCVVHSLVQQSAREKAGLYDD